MVVLSFDKIDVDRLILKRDSTRCVPPSLPTKSEVISQIVFDTTKEDSVKRMKDEYLEKDYDETLGVGRYTNRWEVCSVIKGLIASLINKIY